MAMMVSRHAVQGLACIRRLLHGASGVSAAAAVPVSTRCLVSRLMYEKRDLNRTHPHLHQHAILLRRVWTQI